MAKVDMRARIGAAMVDAAIAAFRVPGQTMVELDLDLAQEGAVVALAMLIEADPMANDAAAIDVMIAHVAAQLRAQVQTFRDDFDATGDRLWLIMPSNRE